MGNADDDTEDISAQLSIEEAKAIMRGGLGKAELELVTSFCAPLYWVIRSEQGAAGTRNGTSFFLDAGRGVFGVTASHVIEGWRIDREQGGGPLRVGGQGWSFMFNWADRAIDAHPGIDIATFCVSPAEVSQLCKVVLTGYQKSWPPKKPTVNCGIYYCGYPGIGIRQASSQEVIFGAVPGSGVATSVSDRDVSFLIERQYLMPALGGGIPPENFDFRGISGGLMLTVVQSALRSWMLAGVIYEGPSTSANPDEAIAGLEIIRARRAHFIRPDGTLDRALWHSLGG
jgi:hypothetical protein